jgi:hypothetical protein
VAIKIKPQMVIESQILKKRLEAEKAKIAAEREAERKKAEEGEQNEESVELDPDSKDEKPEKVKSEKKDNVKDWDDIPDF